MDAELTEGGPVGAGPVSAEPVVAQPAAADGAAAGPVGGEPVGGEPVVAQPAGADSAAAEPGETEPVVARPGAAAGAAAGPVGGEPVAALRRALVDLREAAELSATRLGPDPAATALMAAVRLEERLDRGVEHTIVAVQGGTGSGKSSLFNAIAQMDFAEVSAIRPTTDKPNACVWGEGAEELLEWLGVDRDAWIKRDSVLEEHIGEFRGLILVDLPDYDSAVQAHQLTADRLLPLADVLVWVTDPQKYADPALHQRFAEVARAHPGRANVVVLNQIDLLDPSEAGQIARSLTELLVGDSLPSITVASVSAVTGDGVAALRQELTAHTAHRTAGLRHAAADLVQAARRLAEDTSATQVDAAWLAAAVAAAVDALVAEAAPGGQVAPAVVPDAAALRAVCDDWAVTAMDHLPDQWSLALAYAVGSPVNIAARLTQALSVLDLPLLPGRMARWWRGKKVARERRAEWERRLRGAIEPVVDRTLARPTAALLADISKLAELTDRVAAAGAAAGGEL
ncbi:MAG: 50S ribosome-binding GTPase [Bifidobacteriaceae bacterium]|jgi:GTP-binding protein EngB required for normal cell division|nr:50S ribosome-binding GTPase [Bifidobacteriaceae bacterium]